MSNFQPDGDSDRIPLQAIWRDGPVDLNPGLLTVRQQCYPADQCPNKSKVHLNLA